MVILTRHYTKRFYQRQAKTKRIESITEMAFAFGKSIKETKYGKYSKELAHKERTNCSTAKVYKGFIYWFNDNRAVTLYPLPNKYRVKA